MKREFTISRLLYPKEKIFSLFVFAFFTYASINFFVKLFPSDGAQYHALYFFLIIGILHAAIYYFYFQLIQFFYKVKIHYIQYLIESILYGLFVLFFAFLFQKLISQEYSWNYIPIYATMMVFNFVFASLLYLIKR
jgi:hypothetical protein